MIEFAVAGALGGFAKSLAEQKGKVALPRVEESDDGEGHKVKYVHLGFAVNVVLGAIVSAYMASDPLGAFTTGVTAVFIVEKFFEKTVVN